MIHLEKTSGTTIQETHFLFLFLFCFCCCCCCCYFCFSGVNWDFHFKLCTQVGKKCTPLFFCNNDVVLQFNLKLAVSFLFFSFLFFSFLFFSFLFFSFLFFSFLFFSFFSPLFFSLFLSSFLSSLLLNLQLIHLFSGFVGCLCQPGRAFGVVCP